MSVITRICDITRKEFIVTEAEQEHIRTFEELHPLLKKGDIPLPKIHPLEHLRQMHSYVTLTSLFESKSVLSQKSQITRYNPELGYKVCTYEEFWDDNLDNVQFGQEYDFDRPFFEQWNELMHQVYMQPLVQINCENSSYVDSSSNLKNCYMCFGVGESEDCLYVVKSRYPLKNKDCIDCVGIIQCELCYACVDSDNCYACQHCQDCVNCSDLFCSYDLIGCKNCFGCFGLRRKEFCIFNKQVTQKEYKTFLKSLDLGDYQVRSEQIKKCEEFIANSGHQSHQIKQSENATGDYLSHCRNIVDCYLGDNLEDCGYSTGAYGKDGWRSELYHGELAYNSAVLFGRLGFGNSIHTGSENFYSYMIFNCDSCFGCAMLKKKSYCILNKQYTKAEYFELIPRIIAHMKQTGEWGQFLPPQYAPHYYEESQSYDWYMPISAANTKERGYRIRPGEIEPTEISGAVKATELPMNSKEINSDEILRLTIKCSTTGKAYRFTRKEIDFYQKHHIPLPRIHWEERLRNLMRKRRLIPSI